ncbi:MAG: hypothetical protein KGJ72_15300, partial [Gammaproteobacteria bacterium]|nr:hypothetical protein [Gammaproteobacteria bacterium]
MATTIAQTVPSRKRTLQALLQFACCGATVWLRPPGAHSNPRAARQEPGEVMFTQLLDPLGNLTLTCLVALVPVVSLLVLL